MTLAIKGQPVYGQTKAVHETFGDKLLLIRPSWLSSVTENNFAKTMLKLLVSAENTLLRFACHRQTNTGILKVKNPETADFSIGI